jgi:uncharacterized protein
MKKVVSTKRMIMRTSIRDFEIELNESDTANAIWLALPIDAYANVWGKEIYFEIPVEMGLEKGKTRMELGEVAYWPQGKALCFFFGPTPASGDDVPVAISPVTPVGMVNGDPSTLEDVGDRTAIKLIKG